MDEQQALQQIEVRRRRKKRRKWSLIGLVILVFAGILGTYPAMNYLARREWEKAVAEAQREDGPWRIDDLEAKRAVVPEAENSYQIVRKALPLLPAQWPSWRYAGNSQDRQPLEKLKQVLFNDAEPNLLEPGLAKELQKEMNRLDAAVREIRRFIDMPRGRTPIVYSSDGISTKLSGTMDCRQMASVLQYDTLLRVQDGDGEGALADCQGIDKNRAALLKLENQLVEVAKLPVEQQVQKIKQLQRLPPDLPVLARLMFAPVVKACDATFRIQAELRCAIVLLAVERYRRTHGRWPASAQDLVPEYLAGVPTDPFDGKPIRMKAVRDGLIIYSIGLDEEDNNGNLDSGQSYTNKGTDLGSRLWNVDQRRLP
jgi:hypothetical protein